MNSDAKVRTILCPRCKKPTVYSSENAFRPFCSERCRLIDLGAWANEDYRVPTHENPPPDLASDADDEDTRH